MNLIKRLFIASALASSASEVTANQVTYLEVNGDTVTFATDEVKQHTLPGCVAAGNEDKWSISLASDSGRAMYSLILTAMAKSGTMGLAVNSANDCAVSVGVERTASVNLTQAAGSSSSLTGRIGVYKWDLETRVGTLANLDGFSTFTYIDGSENVTGKRLSAYYRVNDIHFETTDCTGTPYIADTPYTHISNPGYLRGKFVRRDSASGQSLKMSSKLAAGDGECKTTNHTKTWYQIMDSTPHDVCGEGPCIMKEE